MTVDWTSNMNDSILRDAKIVWEYMLMHHTPTHADIIFGLGSNDTRVAERVAELFLQGLAPLIVFSGGNGKASRLDRPEAEVFAEIAIQRGVPKEKILLESRATNTGENILFTKTLLDSAGINVQKVILVQKPYMERRTFATFKKQWPGPECVVTSPQISFVEYETDEEARERFIHVMVGDLERIQKYPKLGYQIEQDIPPEVWEAQSRLLDAGYTKYALQ